MVRVLMRNQDAKIVLIDTYSTNAIYYAWTIAELSRRLKIPYIPILHGGALEGRLERSPKMCKRLFSLSAVNVAPSRFLQSAFEKHAYDVEVIPNPLDLGDYKFTRRHEVKPRLLYVRSFDRIYNPCLAVKILAELSREFPAATLCMVGPDKDGSRTEVEKLAQEMGVFEKIRFTGKLLPITWRKLSIEYDIFINTTNVDNTPVSVVEAMALGLPVVSTCVGGVPYLLTDGEDGILVEPNRADQFVSAIKELIDQPEFVAKLTWNARNTAAKCSESNVRNAWKKLILDHKN